MNHEIHSRYDEIRNFKSSEDKEYIALKILLIYSVITAPILYVHVWYNPSFYDYNFLFATTVIFHGMWIIIGFAVICSCRRYCKRRGNKK